MQAHTYKIVEVVGTSEQSLDQAISNGIGKASKTLHNLEWYEVAQIRGHVTDGKVAHHQVTLRIGFRLD